MSHQADETLSLGIQCALKARFLPEANVCGVLAKADIGPISWGFLYGNDEVAKDGEFIRFVAIGTDNRLGYDIVRTDNGRAFAIVSYAEHAKERGLSLLQEHIRHNPEYYAQLSKA